MTRGGLLIAGVVVPVDGVEVDNPLTAPWCQLGPEDYRARREPWIRQIIVHTTKGLWPQHIIPGEGPDDMERVVANYWRLSTEGKRRQSAAHIVVGCKWSSAACLADVVRAMAYHATLSNPWSIGIEMYQLANGGIYEATLATTVRVCIALCNALGIPFQIVGDAYAGPLARMLHGGPDCVGIFGHRDNTHDRGRGDPGDAIGVELEHAGAERMHFATGEDLKVCARRQRKLNAMGEQLTIDGLAGPAYTAALRRHGFRDGRELDAAAEAQ